MAKEKISVMIAQEEVERRIKELAEELNTLYVGESLCLVCILKGSVMFLAELAKYLTMPVTMDFIQVSSYGDGTVSSGKLNIKLDLSEEIKDKNVLIVEDIIDTGRTLKCLKEMLAEREPKTLRICTLLDKPERRTEGRISADYTGFVIEDKFVVGYGLDYAQKYRNLPYIGVIEFIEE